MAEGAKLGNLIGMRFRPAVHFFGVAFCLAMACSSNSGSSGDGGSDAPVAALDCQGIRLCLAKGGTAADCAARGTPEGRAAFQTLFECLTAHCSDQSAACFCEEACHQPDGYCLDQTDACVAASKTDTDAVCGTFCGG